MGMDKNFEVCGKKYCAVLHPGGFPAVYIFPFEESSGKVYEGYDAETEEDLDWHIAHFKQRVQNGEDPFRVLTGWMADAKGLQRVYASKYINSYTREKGIKAEVDIDGSTYVVDLANVPTTLGNAVTEVAYWKKGEREVNIFGYMREVSEECFKEAVNLLILDISKKPGNVFIQF